MAIVSRYWNQIRETNASLEIIFLYFCLVSITNQSGLSNYFPADSIVIIILLFGFLIFFKKMNRKTLFLAKGITKGLIGWSALFVLFSTLGLATWFYFQEGNPYARLMPEAPIPLFILLGIGFAFINAAFEEGLFRSIFFVHFSEMLGSFPAIIMQAIWFSLLHYQSGFPSGSIGILLTFLFGSLMGYLVHRTRGILIPVVIHAFADFSLFILILMRMNNLF